MGALLKPATGLLARSGLKGSQGQSTLAATTLAGGSIAISGFGVTLSASAGKGKSDGQDLTYSNTRVEAGYALHLTA